MSARESGEEVDRNRGKIAERLVEEGYEVPEGSRVIRLHHQFMMVRAESRSDFPRVSCFVVRGLPKPDRERLEPRHEFTHERDDQTGIDPAGEKYSDRHVGEQVRFDGLTHQRPESLTGFLHCERFPLSPEGELKPPIALGSYAVGVNDDHRARKDLLNGFENRPRRRYVAEG